MPSEVERTSPSATVAAPPHEFEGGEHVNDDQFRRIVGSIPGLIFTYDSAGRIAFVNRQLLDYLGCAPEHLQCWERSNVIHPDDLERVTLAWRENTAAGVSHTYEKRLRRADGIYRWFQLQCSPSLDADGRISR